MYSYLSIYDWPRHLLPNYPSIYLQSINQSH